MPSLTPARGGAGTTAAGLGPSRWLLVAVGLEPAVGRDFIARSVPGVDAVSGLTFPLWGSRCRDLPSYERLCDGSPLPKARERYELARAARRSRRLVWGE